MSTTPRKYQTLRSFLDIKDSDLDCDLLNTKKITRKLIFDFLTSKLYSQPETFSVVCGKTGNSGVLLAVSSSGKVGKVSFIIPPFTGYRAKHTDFRSYMKVLIDNKYCYAERVDYKFNQDIIRL